jgi:hypothetical protein
MGNKTMPYVARMLAESSKEGETTLHENDSDDRRQ